MKYIFVIFISVFLFFCNVGRAQKNQLAPSSNIYLMALQAILEDSSGYFSPEIRKEYYANGNLATILPEITSTRDDTINNVPITYLSKSLLCSYLGKSKKGRTVLYLSSIDVGQGGELIIRYSARHVEWVKGQCNEKLFIGGSILNEERKDYVTFIFNCKMSNWELKK